MIRALDAPAGVATPELVEWILGVSCVVVRDPLAKTPMIVPAFKNG